MRSNAVVSLALLILASSLSALEPSPAAGFPPPRSPVVFDSAGNILAATAYPGALPQFRERYVSDHSSAEPWLAFTLSGRALYNSIQAGSDLVSTLTEQSPTVASDDNGKTWIDVSPKIANQESRLVDGANDTMIATDYQTGRIYKTGTGPCLSIFWSDDQGASWTRRPVACDWGGDHPTLFVGRERSLLPNQQPPVYGCWNSYGSVGPPDRLGYTAETVCSRSDDGGLTWLPVGKPFSHPPVCAENLEGESGFGSGSRIDDTIFLPSGKCGVPWVAISHDNGNHWDDVAIDQNLGMSPEIMDAISPQMAEDSAGNLYYAWIAGDALPRIAISHTRGRTWSAPIVVSPPGVTYAKFASIAAGSSGHVAITYVGTNVSGGYWASQSDIANAEWHAYSTMTLDAGTSSPVFASAQIDPVGDPIKRGPCYLRCYAPDGFTGMYDYLRADANPVTGSVMLSLVDLCIDGCPDPNASKGRAAVGVQVEGTGLLGSLVDDGFNSDTTPPVVSITDPSTPIAIAGSSTDISGTATDDHEIQKIIVTEGGGLITPLTFTAVCSQCGTSSATWHVHVPLELPGPNKIMATAYDAAGNHTDSTPVVVVST